MIGVIALIGITPIDDGSTLINEQSKAITEPVSIVTGNNVLWLDVFNAMRAMCGTTSPKKLMGPQ